ncbi:MAG: D-alanine--D-alanine ligase [Clostridia bacterium]|nr:D-alanine--D-alanine ligase [Clostridia bacterium]
MKKEICVIFGGRSPEHDISRKSVTSIIRNMDKSKYNLHIVGITKDGRWLLYTGSCNKIESGEWEKEEESLKKAIISPDTSDGGLLVFEESGVRHIKLDCIFPVLHGEYGEDGTIQGLFELSGVKYVGVGVAGSANSMDKTLTKVVMKNAGIPQADWVTVTCSDDFYDKLYEIETKLGYPCFVKPATTGSSVGVGKAVDRNSLENAINLAMKYSRKVLVEENIDGHEVECSVLGNENPAAGEVGEIVPAVEFYDFDAKYNDNSTKLHIPAELPEAVREQVRSLAVSAFRAIDGSGLARVDFFVRKSDNKVILNEINTMPGFTNISMYPKLWEACGLKYSDLLDRLVELAEERKK